LEADSESALEDEEHGGGADAGRIWGLVSVSGSGKVLQDVTVLTSNACFVLDLVDECCLDDHYGCHYGDH
jgi:hypothetical protein